jgi:hypothetical protein
MRLTAGWPSRPSTSSLSLSAYQVNCAPLEEPRWLSLNSGAPPVRTILLSATVYTACSDDPGRARRIVSANAHLAVGVGGLQLGAAVLFDKDAPQLGGTHLQTGAQQHHAAAAMQGLGLVRIVEFG